VRLPAASVGVSAPGIPKPLDRKTSFNILVVSARPDADEDLPPRLVSKDLAGIVTQIALESDIRARIEMVRPATLQTLEDHLKSRPKGYFSLVQFDVQGVEDADGKSVVPWSPFGQRVGAD
jgi:hypothetical protein